jgi:hypothetical protein
MAHALDRHSFPFEPDSIPDNGVYLLFEEGEPGHGGARIVRTGSHRGQGNLVSRLREHFVVENKDRSIFRKNIGRALLHREDDPFLEDWNLDLTPRAARERHGDRIDFEKQDEVEGQVSHTIHERFTFATLRAKNPSLRKDIERGLIATISLCRECGPSDGWLGIFSPVNKIRQSGLWQTQHLWKEDELLTAADVERLNRNV